MCDFDSNLIRHFAALRAALQVNLEVNLDSADLRV